MNIKLKNIQRFTMSCGIGGAIAAAIGVGAIGGATLFKTIYPGEIFDSTEPKIGTMFKFGGIALGAGLFAVGLGVAVAKYAGENLPDSYFTSGVKGFTEDEEKYLAHTHKCNNCKYFHGHQYYGVDLICGIYPAGFEGNICPDWEQKLDN